MKTFEAEWRARFERFACTYEDEAKISGWSEAGLQRRLRLFCSLLPSLNLPPLAAVLDLGCGAGTYVRLLAGLGHRAVGLDYSLPSLARAVAADPGWKGRYVAGEAYALPFKDGTFNLVVSIGVLQALEHPERALDEMVRVLHPGGTLVVEALNGRGPVTLARQAARTVQGLPSHVRTYDPRKISSWLEERGLRLLRKVGLYLPPRHLPGLAHLLDLAPVVRALEASPGLAGAAAHAFLFVAQKPGACSERGL